jgi:protein TonB
MKNFLLALLILSASALFAQGAKDSATSRFRAVNFDTSKLYSEKDSLGDMIYYVLDSSGNKLYYSVQIESEFDGGMYAWRNFLLKNLNPEAVSDKIKTKDIPKNGLKFTAELEFTVCKDGSLCDFKVINETHPAAKEEALRVIRLSPNWKPGVQNGVFVKSKKRQKITFVVTKD